MCCPPATSSSNTCCEQPAGAAVDTLPHAAVEGNFPVLLLKAPGLWSKAVFIFLTFLHQLLLTSPLKSGWLRWALEVGVGAPWSSRSNSVAKTLRSRTLVTKCIKSCDSQSQDCSSGIFSSHSSGNPFWKLPGAVFWVRIFPVPHLLAYYSLFMNTFSSPPLLLWEPALSSGWLHPPLQWQPPSALKPDFNMGSSSLC